MNKMGSEEWGLCCATAPLSPFSAAPVLSTSGAHQGSRVPAPRSHTPHPKGQTAPKAHSDNSSHTSSSVASRARPPTHTVQPPLLRGLLLAAPEGAGAGRCWGASCHWGLEGGPLARPRRRSQPLLEYSIWKGRLPVMPTTLRGGGGG